MSEDIKLGMMQSGGLDAQASIADLIKFKNMYKIECFGADGKLKWSEEFPNLVVDAGLNYMLDAGLSAGTPITTWYVGLKDTGNVVAGDTMGSHAGWTENTTYSNAARPTWVDGGVSAKNVDNSASKAVFNINGTTTIYGAFLVSNNTKGGTTGTLYGGGNFSASRAVVNGDTLNVTVACTAA